MKEIHPDAWIFPVMSEEEYERFADSIEREGLLFPIVLLDGKVLDGRHRLRACIERGVDAEFVDWDPECGVTPLEWVIAVNLQRRQLTTAQRGALAAEVGERLGEAARGRRTRDEHGRFKSVSSNSTSRLTREERRKRSSREIAARQFGVSPNTVWRAKSVLDRDSALFERVKSGELAISEALRLAGETESRNRPQGRRDLALRDAIAPARRYLKNWDPSWLSGVTPAQARRLLRQVQEVDAALFEVERALEARTVVSRALR